MDYEVWTEGAGASVGAVADPAKWCVFEVVVGPATVPARMKRISALRPRLKPASTAATELTKLQEFWLQFFLFALILSVFSYRV